MRQVVYEVAHDSSYDQTCRQLGGTQAMEEDAWVVRGRCFRFAIEQLNLDHACSHTTREWSGYERVYTALSSQAAKDVCVFCSSQPHTSDTFRAWSFIFASVARGLVELPT